MATRAEIETRRDRNALVADAGYNRLSLLSIVAGVLSAYGAFAVLAGVTVGVVEAANVDIDVSSQWRDLGVAGGLVVAGLLFLSYLFGGYVAGRMARRSGALHGAGVFLLGVVLVAAAAALARQLGGAEVAASNLRELGVPTTASEWGDIATVAGLASLAAMLVGSLLGGSLGERWHAKLLTRALDPRVGAEAEALQDAERRAAEAERRAADADERRTGAFERVRAATPGRTRRVDGDAPTRQVVMNGDTDRDGDGRTDDDRTDPRLETATGPQRWRSDGRTG
ncbi:MAG: hypothetical protein ACLGI2_10990 [Acidimicrobiia bacterium]